MQILFNILESFEKVWVRNERNLDILNPKQFMMKKLSALLQCNKGKKLGNKTKEFENESYSFWHESY